MKIKTFLAILIFAAFYSLGMSQSDMPFEGVVKYKFLMSDVTGLSDEEIELELEKSAPMFGRHLTYYFRGPDLKSDMDGPYMKMTSFYDGSDSLYMYSADLGELMKASTYDDWNFTFDTNTITKNAKVINGIECDLLEIKSKDYTWKYYFNEKYKLDPKDHKNYQHFFWNVAIKETNSLPLRVEGKIPGTYMFIEAEEILPSKLEDAVFEVPKN